MKIFTLIAALGFALTGQAEPPHRYAIPNRLFTPGAVDFSVSLDELLQPGYAQRVRSVPAAVRRHVFQHYFGTPTKTGYVLDHLVPLEIGGSNAVWNLWPQPAAEAREKDKLENRMAALLRLTRRTKGTEAAENLLVRFQAEVSSDWETAALQFVQ